jgi:hypothetical protein
MQENKENRRMFKVISPVATRDGGTFWLRCGHGYTNRDESINIYLDSLPLGGLAKDNAIKLQIREYTEAELRERAEKRATYQARSTVGPNGLPMYAANGRDIGNAAPGSVSNEQIPF